MLKATIAALFALLLVLGATACTPDHSDKRAGHDIVPLPVPPVLHVGRTYYVSPRGNDANPGTGSWPLRTFAKALATLHPGDVLFARGGTYDEQVHATTLAAGTPKRRITVANAPGERPVIRGQLWLAYPSYWTISGINVTSDGQRTNEHMVNIYGGTDWVLEGSEIWGARSYAGLLIGDGKRNNLGRFDVRNNCIHDTYPTNGANQDHNIYIDDTTKSPYAHGVIERNLIFDAYNGRGIKLGPPGGTGGPRNVTVRYNTFFGAYQNVSLSRDASHNRIYRNIFSDATDASIGAYHLAGTDNLAYDNLTFDSARIADAGITLGPGNRFPLDPQFDRIGCDGFHPRVAAARAYGRFAPAP
jgi:hypothetical protein